MDRKKLDALLEKITPESLNALTVDEKRRLQELIEDAQLTQFQRYWKTLRKNIEAHSAACYEDGEDYGAIIGKGLADRIAAIRRGLQNGTRKATSRLADLAELPDEVERQARIRADMQAELDAEIAKARLQAEQERTEGHTVDGAEPGEPVAVPLNNPRHQREREAAEAAYTEARQRAEGDYIDRICGPGSDKPSGPFWRGWMH